MQCNYGNCKKIRKGIGHKKNTCTELNIKHSNHKFYYVAFLVTAGLSAPFFEIFTYILSDLNMTLLNNCFMNNINDIGMVDKSGFDMCNREYMDRFNTTLLSIITISVLVSVTVMLFTINERKHIDQKISDLLNIKTKQ